jgi:hypothetical protein
VLPPPKKCRKNKVNIIEKMRNIYKEKINFNLKKSVSSFCKQNEYVNAIDEGYGHEQYGMNGFSLDELQNRITKVITMYDLKLNKELSEGEEGN